MVWAGNLPTHCFYPTLNPILRLPEPVLAWGGRARGGGGQGLCPMYQWVIGLGIWLGFSLGPLGLGPARHFLFSTELVFYSYSRGKWE